jgi:hypothetical protein
MATKSNRSKAIGEEISDGLDAIAQPAADVQMGSISEVPVTISESSEPQYYNLTDHPDFVLQPNIPQIILYRGDRLDLCKLRPSQFVRLTTNADAAKIVRRR